MEYIQTIKEIWEFLMHRKKWWLFPIFLVLISLGGLIVFSASSPLAPFIYTLF